MAQNTQDPGMVKVAERKKPLKKVKCGETLTNLLVQGLNSMKHLNTSYIICLETLQKAQKKFDNITYFGSAKLHFGHSVAPGKLFNPLDEYAAIRKGHWTQTLAVQANNMKFDKKCKFT